MPFYFSEDSVGFTGSGTGGGGTSVAGAVNYKGTWNALTNTPTLSNSSGGGANGDYYLVSVGGSTSLDGLSTWNVGDWVVSNGSIWERLLGQGSSFAGALLAANNLSDLTDTAAARTNLGVTNSRINKSGELTPSDFSGNPLVATVTFATPFPDLNYEAFVEGQGTDVRVWSVFNKTPSGFSINSNASNTILNNVFWFTIKTGE